SDTTSPLEAGLGWITKFNKEFTNSENLKKQKEAGVSRKIVAFEMQERAVPRHDYEIVDGAGTVIGLVTSGTMSPSMNIGIGLGYVTVANSAVGNDIFIRIRKNDVPAKVVKLPFYKK
ncbi:MAG TPA: glycine cleavage T C-terminal barrel domain-containing protein, partial [Flavobacterium sp.]|nr:glycine cleavage T C-terminal barrel domain-containing protein [Flavobacterium sp.]